jgi:DNA-binding beta-propeller fold protein YncE
MRVEETVVSVRGCVLIAAALAAPSMGAGGAMGSDVLYWTDRTEGAIFRAELDGSGLTPLISGLSGPQGLTVDPIRAHLYWADSTDLNIKRANLDGSGVTTVVDGMLFVPKGLAIDVVNEKLYWTDPAFNTIGRSDLDGQNVETMLSGLAQPQDIAVDSAGSRIFWASGASGILTSSIDAPLAIPLSQGFAGSTTVVALSADGGRAYWAAASRISFTSTTPDGCTVDLPVFLSDALGLTVDPATGDILWTEGTEILRTDAGGQSITTVLSGLSQPWRLTIGPGVVAPSILEQPTSVIAANTDVEILHVEAAGSAPLTYQWLRDGQVLSGGGAFSGVHTPSLTIGPIGLEQVGAYACVVTNAHGQVTSQPAVLAVRACTADINGDGQVDLADFAALALSFGSTDLMPGACSGRAAGDIDGDGSVTLDDFAVLSMDFGCQR